MIKNPNGFMMIADPTKRWAAGLHHAICRARKFTPEVLSEADPVDTRAFMADVLPPAFYLDVEIFRRVMDHCYDLGVRLDDQDRLTIDIEQDRSVFNRAVVRLRER